MTPAEADMISRAEAAFETFLTRIPERDRPLTRESHRIAFKAGYVMACTQNQWRTPTSTGATTTVETLPPSVPETSTFPIQ